MKEKIVKIILYGTIFFLLAGLMACVQPEDIAKPIGSATLVNIYTSVDDLIKDAPIIVVGVVGNETNQFMYGGNADEGGVPFGLTEFKVETLIRGIIPENIHILQTYMEEDPFIQKGDKMILFLYKYRGPVAQDAYMIQGAYQGQYKIVDDKVISTFMKGSPLSQSVDELENINALISRINELGYQPKTNNLTK